MKEKKIRTDSLGFALIVKIVVDDHPTAGRHTTYEDENGFVPAEAEHTINIQRGMVFDYQLEVIAHEVYHVLYSVRPLIKCDEETETEVFGQLVKHVYNFVLEVEASS